MLAPQAYMTRAEVAATNRRLLKQSAFLNPDEPEPKKLVPKSQVSEASLRYRRYLVL